MLDRIGSWLRWVPLQSNGGVAARLARRANAARDARHYLAAAALYQEALRLTPGNARLHIQAGHMLKEAGDLAGAETHYLAAERLLPNDADLALQLGHFHKIAGRPDEAETAYARALALKPGWSDAADELARVRSSIGDDAGEAADGLIAELLPRQAGAPSVVRDAIQVRRLGGRRMRTFWGHLKLLSGIEAIRGFCISSNPLAALEVAVDDQVIRREVLPALPVTGGAPGQAKYVFNLWHDFSEFAYGRYTIELRFIEARGRVRRNRTTVVIAPPGDPLWGSDAYVPPLSGEEPLDERINARPSVVRSVERRLLPDPVETILVQRVDQMGDLVCSVPAIRRLRELFPQAQLIGLVTAANADLARSLALFDEVIVADYAENPEERRRVMDGRAQERLRRALAEYRFDFAIDLGEGSESRPLLLMSGAPFLYGFKDREAPWLTAGLDLNGHDAMNGLEVMPPSRKLVALVESLGVLARDQSRVEPLAVDPTSLAAFGIAPGERYAVLHAGARLAYSRWPHFARLAELLLERTDLKIVIFAEPDTDLPPPAERITMLTDRLEFASFEALLAGAAVFVGNDSGPKHLAALRGTPVVSLHMARLNWSEWGQEMTGSIISRRVPCAGCAIGWDGDECGRDFVCLHAITADEVLAAVLSHL